MNSQLPTQAQVVIIGGGIVGCSTAYHLVEQGWKDVVLLERKKISSGTSWAAAGLLGQLWSTSPLTKLAKYGADLYAGLEAKTGQPTGYKRNGSIRVSRTPARRSEYLRSLGMARAFGIKMEEISMEEAKRLFPVMETGDLTGAWYQPDDGVTNPEDTTQALAKGARMGGVTILENIKVLDIDVSQGAVNAVKTDKGDIRCEYIVNCAGMWGREVGKMVGVSLPLVAAEHMHMTTEPMEGVYKDMPYLRDMDGYIYIKEEMGGLLMGGFEPNAKTWGVKGIPENFEHTQLDEDWDQMDLFIKNAIIRVPAFAEIGVTNLTTVPESFTPDTSYLLGEAPGVKNFFVACGMNSVGITSAGGAGMAIATWIVQGYPEVDLWPVDVRRYNPWQNNLKYIEERVNVESVGNLYTDHWPFKQPTSSRDVLKTPIHDRLKDLGACFGVVSGWERANWFAPEGVEPKYEYSWGRQNWFEYSAREHMNIRENVGIYDLTSMGKFLFQGRNAQKVLQTLCGNDVAVPVGKVVYTQMLNERGGIEADLTVTKMEEDKFFIVTAGATTVRDFDWIKRHIPIDAHAVLTDVTWSYTMLGVMGPKSRDLLSKITDTDLSNDAFPFATAKEIHIGYAGAFAIRMSFVGELGWELYIPTPFAQGIFDALMDAGKEFNVKPCGLHAVDSLRMEKGYRHWSGDITPDDTPFEAGLGFAVKLNKDDFIGKDALLKQKKEGIKRKLVIFTIDDPEPLIYHDEPLYCNGEIVGENTHGSYSHVTGHAIGMVYLSNEDGITDEWIMGNKYEIEVEDKKYPVTIHLRAPYDPEGKSIKA
ncbi:MAG: FAD-dependent oxidoreductase [Deltaproteobacteria bacterium]|nr:MAG: FAD-dependent oxidoreductase [Deltaproteobacteria bacterium]